MREFGQWAFYCAIACLILLSCALAFRWALGVACR